MADSTGIEWADRTFSPWEGCQKVGPGCDHCYAEARNTRFLPKDKSRLSNWGPGAPRKVMSDSYWAAPWRWNEELGRAGRRESVFPSLCDPFDNTAPAGQRERFANLILGTPNLEWLLLTKRIGNVVAMLAEMFPNGTPPNIRIGATIVNQAEWDRDHAKIVQAYVATGRQVFLSMEPLLGRVELASIRYNVARAIGWIIVGGESGPGARPMHPDAARFLREQAEAMSIPFMFKQWGEWSPDQHGAPMFGRGAWEVHAAWPDGSTGVGSADTKGGPAYPLYRVGKKLAGRLLDGREWNGFPLNHTS